MNWTRIRNTEKLKVRDNLHDNAIFQFAIFAHIFFQPLSINIPWDTQNLRCNLKTQMITQSKKNHKKQKRTQIIDCCNKKVKIRTKGFKRKEKIEVKRQPIPLHVEVNELVDGRIKSESIFLLGQQLHLLNNMNPPTILQIRRVHVPNRVVDRFSLLKTRGSEILQENISWKPY